MTDRKIIRILASASISNLNIDIVLRKVDWIYSVIQTYGDKQELISKDVLYSFEAARNVYLRKLTELAKSDLDMVPEECK